MGNKLQKEQSKRYYLLDSIRGICILGMIVYHTLFDIGAFMGVEITGVIDTVLDVIRDFGVCLFVSLSGICVHFAKRPLKRALEVFCSGILVSLVTFFVVPEMTIIFGILSFMGTAALLMIPLKKYVDKLPAVPFAIISFALFLFTFEVSSGYFGYYGIEIAKVPTVFYRDFITAKLGFPPYWFSSSDYYPMVPWIFMFFFGFFIWKILSKSKAFLRILEFRIRFLEFVGRKSLYIYIIHQPVILGVLLLVNLILTSK